MKTENKPYLSPEPDAMKNQTVYKMSNEMSSRVYEAPRIMRAWNSDTLLFFFNRRTTPRARGRPPAELNGG